MSSRSILAGCLVLLSLGSLANTEELAVTVKDKREAVKDSPQRAGLEFVERSLEMGNMLITYHQTIDPKQADMPVVQQYGDYRLGCAFPGSWNWDLEYFLEVQVTRPGEPPFAATRAMLQEGIYALEQGKRGVAEMVWPLPPAKGAAAGAEPARLAVRLVKLASELDWFYIEARIDGDPQAQISQVRLGAYPFTTTGPPERQRWMTTLNNAYRMTDGQTKFNPASEWGVVLHNKLAHEEGGCLLVFDPEQIAASTAGGTYNVAVTLAPKPDTRSVRLALGYFWDMPYPAAVTQFRRDAPAILARLRAMQWSVSLDGNDWTRLRTEVEELLTHTGMTEQFGTKWAGLSGEIEAALAAAKQDPTAARKAERQYGLLMLRAREFKAQMYGAALEALVKEAGL